MLSLPAHRLPRTTVKIPAKLILLALHGFLVSFTSSRLLGRKCVSKSVLIVEDEPFIVEALSYLLSREGFAVSSCADGNDAVNHLHKTNPDLLILDMMLPHKSGMEILEELRNLDAYQKLPVLVLTAKGQKKDRLAAENAGASLFMSKPFSNNDIVAAARGLLKI